MEKIFADIPTNLTPSVMAALGEQLRGCSSELARIGAPSARLQPVHALVEKACGEYDEGAQCFATAAGVGIPFAGTAAEREQTLALECGFAASEGIIPLADALNQGAEITFSRLSTSLLRSEDRSLHEGADHADDDEAARRRKERQWGRFARH